MQNAQFSRALTAKQSRFIDEYMVDMNGAAATVRCGYSPKTSRAIACELLTKPDIQAELQARGAALARDLEITRTGVVKNLLDVFSMSRELKNPAATKPSNRTLTTLPPRLNAFPIVHCCGTQKKPGNKAGLNT